MRCGYPRDATVLLPIIEELAAGFLIADREDELDRMEEIAVRTMGPDVREVVSAVRQEREVSLVVGQESVHRGGRVTATKEPSVVHAMGALQAKRFINVARFAEIPGRRVKVQAAFGQWGLPTESPAGVSGTGADFLAAFNQAARTPDETGERKSADQLTEDLVPKPPHGRFGIGGPRARVPGARRTFAIGTSFQSPITWRF
jgi:hypothetical protein